MVLGIDDAQCEVQRIGRQPTGDLLRPFHRKTVGAHEKVFQHKRIDLPIIFQPVSIEMDQRATATAMQGEDIEGRTGDAVGYAKALGEPLHESGFPDAKIAVKREGGVGWQGLRKEAGERLGFAGGMRRDAGAKFSEDAHNRDRRLGRWYRRGVGRGARSDPGR